MRGEVRRAVWSLVTGHPPTQHEALSAQAQRKVLCFGWHGGSLSIGMVDRA